MLVDSVHKGYGAGWALKRSGSSNIDSPPPPPPDKNRKVFVLHYNFWIGLLTAVPAVQRRQRLQQKCRACSLNITAGLESYSQSGLRRKSIV
jgi:hypothetical protein